MAMAEVEGERHIEMLWRCTSCQNKNLGRFKVCQTCKNPKDGSEAYEMPEDTSKAATVTDAALLRMATAGPNWRCAYCQSDQRRLDNGCANCGASAIEGSEVPDAPNSAPVEQLEASTGVNASASSGGSILAIVLGFGLLIGIFGLYAWYENRPRDYNAKVAVAHWERKISVERYKFVEHESFRETLPSDAEAVRSLGKKVHHYEQIPDGFDTERYSVQVPDGYRSESYSVSVSCGQECETVPRSCSEKCTSNKNGFATCRTSCSGGEQRCRTKYCDEQRTRDIPKTRTEWRTRQVPRFRSEPRYAENFAYKHWEWLPERIVSDAGDLTPPRWPEANLGKGLSPGEKERETRTESYRVKLSYDTKHWLEFTPNSEAAFAPFASPSDHKLHKEQGKFTLNGAPFMPSRQD